jgi:hypothetical protein
MRRRRDRRGRPRKANAKRRATTLAARRPDLDRGSEQLRARKRRATTREDVETTPSGILYGRGYLDRQQYDMIAYLTSLLRQVQRAMGGTLSVAALWSAVTGALTGTTPGLPPLVGDNGARQRLGRLCARLDGSKDLVLALAAEEGLPDIVWRALAHRLTPDDLVQLEALRRGLDGISTPRRRQAETC